MTFDYTKYGIGHTMHNSIFHWLQENPAPFTETFGHVDVYAKYLSRIYGGFVAELIISRDKDTEVRTAYDVRQGIRFPHDAGLDPSDPETVVWAKFAIDRDIEFHPDYSMKMGRFTNPGAQVRQLIDAGVSLRYAEALDMATWNDKYDVESAIRLASTGVPLEYAAELSAGEPSC